MLDIKKSSQSGFEVITLVGEVDLHVSPVFRDSLLGLFKKNPKGILVDLTEVPYMDSSGIATLVEGLQWSRKKGGEFALVGLKENVADTLKLAKLYGYFQVFENLEEALGEKA